MQGHAKVWIISFALSFYGCARGALDEPQARDAPPTSPSTDAPFNVPAPRSGAGFGGQSGKGGAAGSSAGNAGGAGAGAGAGAAGGIAGAGGTGSSSSLAGGGSGATSGALGTNPVAASDCPSLTRARLPSGECVDRVTEFSVATNPTSIATGSDGRIWFDDGSANQLVQLDDQGRVLNRLPCDAGSTQRELAAGTGDAILWYTDSRAKTVTKLGLDLARTPFALGFAPVGLSLGESGQLWLTEMNQAVYRLNPSDASLMRWPASPSNTILVGPDKNLWFPEGLLIGRLIVTGEKQDFPITDSFADDLCTGPDGAFWFTDGSLHQIGRMTVDGTFSRTYDLPPNSKPFRIIAGPDGALWFTEQAAEKIGRLTLTGELTHYPVPTSGSLPNAITVGPDHNLWFTELFSGKIGRLIPDPVE